MIRWLLDVPLAITWRSSCRNASTVRYTDYPGFGNRPALRCRLSLTKPRKSVEQSVSQRHVWVDHRGPASWHVACGARYRKHQDEDADVDGRIGRIHIRKRALHNTA